MSRTIQRDGSPDGYRGDLACISVITDVEKKHLGGNGAPNVSRIYFEDGDRAGTLRTWYGGDGDGKKAWQEFEPACGVTVKWVDWEAAT